MLIRHNANHIEHDNASSRNHFEGRPPGRLPTLNYIDYIHELTKPDTLNYIKLITLPDH